MTAIDKSQNRSGNHDLPRKIPTDEIFLKFAGHCFVALHEN